MNSLGQALGKGQLKTLNTLKNTSRISFKFKDERIILQKVHMQHYPDKWHFYWLIVSTWFEAEAELAASKYRPLYQTSCPSWSPPQRWCHHLSLIWVCNSNTDIVSVCLADSTLSTVTRWPATAGYKQHTGMRSQRHRRLPRLLMNTMMNSHHHCNYELDQLTHWTRQNLQLQVAPAAQHCHSNPVCCAAASVTLAQVWY